MGGQAWITRPRVSHDSYPTDVAEKHLKSDFSRPRVAIIRARKRGCPIADGDCPTVGPRGTRSNAGHAFRDQPALAPEAAKTEIPNQIRQGR
jgi:hypothetical protein